MGFLREKTVKGHRYIYWCERRRRGKKKGGDGSVRSQDILLGKHFDTQWLPLDGQWLPYYLWNGDIPIRHYFEVALQWYAEALGPKEYSITVDWQSAPKVQLRSDTKDCRSKAARSLKKDLQFPLDSLLERADIFSAIILELSKERAKELEIEKKLKDRSEEYRKYQKRLYSEYYSSDHEEVLADLVEYARQDLSNTRKTLQLWLNSLDERTPKRYRKQTRQKILRMTQP